MKIAVTSRNRRDITEHAGRYRNSRVFDADDGVILDSSLLEMPKQASFHGSSAHAEASGQSSLPRRKLKDYLFTTKPIVHE